MSVSYDSYRDYYAADGPYSQYLTERRRASCYPVNMYRVSQPAGDFSDPPLPEVALLLITGGDAPVTRDMGAGKRQVRMQPGDMEIVSPNTPTDIVCDGHNALIVFTFPFQDMQKAVEEEVSHFNGDFGRLHAAPFRSAVVEKLCWQFWLEGLTQNPHGELYADTLLLELTEALLEAANPPKSQARKAYALAPETMRRIDEWIDVHLHQPITVEDLAALTRMPQTAFCRAFKLTCGQTPYQYVLEKRITAARKRLTKGNSTLAEVAFDCGFSSQQHMTTWFARRLGMAPGRYIQEMMT